jgi:hypothetical protein
MEGVKTWVFPFYFPENTVLGLPGKIFPSL